MTDPSLDPIFDYLREHSGRYSLSALREQLLQTGYDPAEVDRALAVFQEQPTPPASRQRVWPWALLVLAINAAIVGCAFGLATLPMMNGDDVILAPVVVVWAELFGGILLCFPKRMRPLGRALVFGFFLTAGLGVLVLSGVCIYSSTH
ncbi:MAG TPA: hypothetical protein VIJ02_14845 [Thermoanaerobaculia bacterium]